MTKQILGSTILALLQYKGELLKMDLKDRGAINVRNIEIEKIDKQFNSYLKQ